MTNQPTARETITAEGRGTIGFEDMKLELQEAIRLSYRLDYLASNRVREILGYVIVQIELKAAAARKAAK